MCVCFFLQRLLILYKISVDISFMLPRVIEDVFTDSISKHAYITFFRKCLILSLFMGLRFEFLHFVNVKLLDREGLCLDSPDTVGCPSPTSQYYDAGF